MKHLIIENLGPIKRVDVELNRFNFFIGPQSSGKSTIAKVISTCSWVEKEVATTMKEGAIGGSAEFVEQIERFHKLQGYFCSKTEIQYESDIVKISYKENSLDIHLKTKTQYRRGKISYMPAERNMITTPDLEGFEFKHTNLRSFLFDWYKARDLFKSENKANILNLGVKYYYDPTETKFKDRIEHVNGVSYNIPLYSASSGLQSVVPLYVMMQYYTDKYFESFNDRTSFDLDSKMEEIRRRCVVEFVLKPYYGDSYNDAERKKFVDDANAKLRDHDEEMHGLYEKYRAAVDRLTIPVKTDFIIEEPEQNLYPFTQIDLLQTLTALCRHERNHGFTITTHSPYILNYLNVMLMRGMKAVEDKPSIKAEDLCVYVVQNGGVMDLMQTNVITGSKSVNAEWLNQAMREMYGEYKELKAME